MLKRLFFFSFLAATAVALVSAQDSKITMTVKPTPATDGKQMFVNYCAPCHGTDGRGQGPTAKVLKVPPADLTQLSKNNKGNYPATHVISVLKFGAEGSGAHGSKLMPVWGPVLKSVDRPNMNRQDAQDLRIANLVNYVETLQAK